MRNRAARAFFTAVMQWAEGFNEYSSKMARSLTDCNCWSSGPPSKREYGVGGEGPDVKNVIRIGIISFVYDTWVSKVKIIFVRLGVEVLPNRDFNFDEKSCGGRGRGGSNFCSPCQRLRIIRGLQHAQARFHVFRAGSPDKRDLQLCIFILHPELEYQVACAACIIYHLCLCRRSRFLAHFE